MIKAVLNIDSSAIAGVWGAAFEDFFLMEAFVNIRYLINLGLKLLRCCVLKKDGYQNSFI